MRKAALLLMMLVACAPAGTSSTPSLGAIVSRVDVARLLDCGRTLPDYRRAARCLGAEALSQGLELAIGHAHDLAERAVEAAGPAGADDMTDAERAQLAADLDEALDGLAREIDASHEV